MAKKPHGQTRGLKHYAPGGLLDPARPHCRKHPTYTAQRKPRVPCVECWALLIAGLESSADRELAFALMREQGMGKESVL